MTSINYTFTRDDEDITIGFDYEMTPYVAATWHDPAEGGEIEELATYTLAGRQFDLTEAETARLEEYIWGLGE